MKQLERLDVFERLEAGHSLKALARFGFDSGRRVELMFDRASDLPGAQKIHRPHRLLDAGRPKARHTKRGAQASGGIFERMNGPDDSAARSLMSSHECPGSDEAGGVPASVSPAPFALGLQGSFR